MTEHDRTSVLKALDDRHEELLRQLEALNNEIDAALANVRPESVALAAATSNRAPASC